MIVALAAGLLILAPMLMVAADRQEGIRDAALRQTINEARIIQHEWDLYLTDSIHTFALVANLVDANPAVTDATLANFSTGLIRSIPGLASVIIIDGADNIIFIRPEGAGPPTVDGLAPWAHNAASRNATRPTISPIVRLDDGSDAYFVEVNLARDTQTVIGVFDVERVADNILAPVEREGFNITLRAHDATLRFGEPAAPSAPSVRSSLVAPAGLAEDHGFALALTVQEDNVGYANHDPATPAILLTIGLLAGGGAGIGAWRQIEILRKHRDAVKAVAESEAHHRQLFQSSADAILLVDVAGRTVEANASAGEYFGKPRSALIGRPIVESFDPAHPFDLDNAVNPGAPRDLIIRRPDGTRIDVIARVIPWGKRAKYAVFLHDVTPLRAAIARASTLNDELKRSVQSLRAVNQDLDSFARMVSHDLKGPLRGIHALAEAIDEDTRATDPHVRDDIQRLIRETAALRTLVDDLLRLSQDSGGELTIVNVDLTQIAHDVIAELQDREPREVDIQVDPHMIVRADPRLMRIVITNLLSNAWKYTRDTPHPKIAMGSKLHNDSHAYYVRDNGIGFDMNETRRLFTPFQRLPSAASYEGTGVGLATVARIIARHGGRVWAEGRVGEGATFWFTL